MTAASADPGPITRDDIEQSFRAIQTGVVGQVKSKRTRIIQGGQRRSGRPRVARLPVR